MLFGIALAMGQPLPCEQQGRGASDAAIVVDKTDLATAKSNREAIEQALRGGGIVNLPAGLIAVDRAIRLSSGCTLAGAGPKTVIRNVATGAPFGDNCTLQIHPQVYGDAGIGYADKFTRGSRTRIVFSDAASANRYRTGGWLFTFCWNGYTGSDGPRTWVHRVAARSGNTVTLNVEPQPGADSAVYTNAAVRISGAVEGSAEVRIAAGDLAGFTAGRLVAITAGPLRGNECTGEMRRLLSVSRDRVTLDRPLRSTYPDSISLAVLLNPVENVTVRDLTVQPFNNQSPPCYFKYASGLTLQRVTTEGDIHAHLCAGVRIHDCQVGGTINGNSLRDSLVTGGRCRQVYLEEICADCTFANLLISGSSIGGIVCPEGSPSERITLRDCIIEQARDMPILLVGRESVVEGCIVRNSANPVSWVRNNIGGDGTRVSNLTSDLETVIRRGTGVVVENVRSPKLWIGWSGPADQPTGVCLACPNVNTSYLSPATKIRWTITTAAAD